MTRALFALLLISVVAGYSRVGEPAPAAGAGGADDLTPAKARELIPEAAGMPADELRKLGETADATKFRPSNGDSLTWLVMNYVPDPKGPKEPSFRLLGEPPDPVVAAKVIAGPKDKDGKPKPYASVIHAEYITDCTCKTDGDTATGTVTFKAEKAYEGKAEYTARKKDGRWRIEEFRIPDLKLHTALGADGKWVKK
jgi:hypothetical protein